MPNKKFSLDYEEALLDKNLRLVLISNLDKLHTTELGFDRIKKNLALEVNDILLWCKEVIKKDDSVIKRRGKNWYIENKDSNCILTVNVYSYTVITAHKIDCKKL